MPEETQEELMERIKKMSPEELLAFQKSRCIFCQIISGKVQSKKIYEDSLVTAILDINPSNPGHVLVMPKEHYAIMPQVPDKVLRHLFLVVKKLSAVALKSLGARGTNIMVQNGVAAGQKSQHFMVHMIPRKENDGINFVLEKKEMSENDYNVIKSRMQKRVNELFGIKETPAEKTAIEKKPEPEKPKAIEVLPPEKPKEQAALKEPAKPIQTEKAKVIAETNKEVEDLNKDIKKLEKETGTKPDDEDDEEDDDEKDDGKDDDDGVSLDDISKLLG
jgi:histidine triad (HIT) family protein